MQTMEVQQDVLEGINISNWASDESSDILA